jgi:hypothetical protein
MLSWLQITNTTDEIINSVGHCMQEGRIHELTYLHSQKQKKDVGRPKNRWQDQLKNF